MMQDKSPAHNPILSKVTTDVIAGFHLMYVTEHLHPNSVSALNTPSLVTSRHVPCMKHAKAFYI